MTISTISRFYLRFLPFLVGVVIAFCCARASADTNRLSAAQAGGGNAGSSNASISSNGRFVIFQSSASNLVPNDTNGRQDIFTRNQKTGELRRITDGPNSVQSNGDSSEGTVSPESPNGAIALAYTSDATNINFLTNFPDNNGVADIFLYLPGTRFNTRISLGNNAIEANGPSSSPSVTLIPAPDKALVTYASDASNLVAGDSNGVRDLSCLVMRKPRSKGSGN